MASREAESASTPAAPRVRRFLVVLVAVPLAGAAVLGHARQLHRPLQHGRAGARAADRRGGTDVVRPGRVRRARRVHDGLPHHALRRRRRGSRSSSASRSRCVVALLLGFITLRMRGHYLPLATIAWGISLYLRVRQPRDPRRPHRHDRHSGAVASSASSCKDERRYLLPDLGDRARRAVGDATTCSTRGRAARSARSRAASTWPRRSASTPRGSRSSSFVYAALLACISGWLYAHLQRFVNPTPFGINQGIEYLFMAVVGGAGSVWGAVLGATLITLLKQVLQDMLPRLLGRQGNFELVVFGMLMVLLLQFARDGLWPWIARAAAASARRRPVPDAPPLPSARPRAAHGGAARGAQGAQAVRRARRGQRSVVRRSAPGEILGLIGPNGAGKSTTFSLISGALPLTVGRGRASAARASAAGRRTRSRGAASAARSST